MATFVPLNSCTVPRRHGRINRLEDVPYGGFGHRRREVDDQRTRGFRVQAFVSTARSRRRIHVRTPGDNTSRKCCDRRQHQQKQTQPQTRPVLGSLQFAKGPAVLPSLPAPARSPAVFGSPARRRMAPKRSRRRQAPSQVLLQTRKTVPGQLSSRKRGPVVPGYLPDIANLAPKKLGDAHAHMKRVRLHGSSVLWGRGPSTSTEDTRGMPTSSKVRQ